MRQYSKSRPTQWDRLRNLPSSRHKLLSLYVRNNRHLNSSGVGYIPAAYGAADLGWSTAEFQALRNDLVALGDALFDSETDETVACDFFEDNPPMNDAHYRGTLKLVNEVRSPEIRKIATEALSVAWASANSQRAAAKVGKGAVSDALLRRVHASS